MAFHVPDHLPKRPMPADVSSKILYKIDAATRDTLNSSLAASWIHELEDSIQETKQRIHDRIQLDLPRFEHQLETSKNVQNRYASLATRVDELGDAISNQQTGLLPNLVATLRTHSTLTREASDAKILYDGFSYLQRCRNAYSFLITLAESGKLAEAVTKSQDVDVIVKEMPGFLQQTLVAVDLKRRFTATKARVQDQLSDAFSRSILISPTEIIINPVVQVRQSDAMLQLPVILNSLSSASLLDHVTTLRRDLLTYFVDHVLKQPYSISFENSLVNEVKLILIPAPPNTEDLSSRLDNLSNILGFLYSNIFVHLPSQEAAQFLRSLSKPITTSVLNNLLMPTLPFSFGLLPSYLHLLKRAVSFEEKDISSLLQSDGNDGAIKEWSDHVSGHYERRRRIEILELARTEIVELEDPLDTFTAFSEGGPETSLLSVIPIQVDDDELQDDAWGLDEPVTAVPAEETADGWGFDDDMDDLEPEPEAEPEPEPEPEPESMIVDEKAGTNGDDPDPADAWGWNEEEDDLSNATMAEEDNIADDNPWDDPWSDHPETNDVPEPEPEPQPSITPTSVLSPKAATRLEKLASKNKKHVNGNSSSSKSPLSPPPALEPHVTFTAASSIEPEHNPPPKSSRLNPGRRRPQDVVTTIAPKEVYKVPKRTKRIIKMVETAIDESKLFFASNLFGSSPAKDSSLTPGTILVQSASSILDLYQALYPVKFAGDLKAPERGMLFSNSCLYMAGAVQRVEDTIYGQPQLKARLTESRNRLQVLGESWFEDTVEKQCIAVNEILTQGTQGFTNTADQGRYDDCETAVNEALKKIKSIAYCFKGILTKTKYYSAVGSFVDSALSRVLGDILALPDIPEIESHRLSELCRILNALEGIFSEDPQEPSFVVAYVPSWLKFSYLSELLEASLADITYLFEQGALVDFQVDELVNLVRALFADTSLRTNTINKIQGGHSTSSQ